jgi:predicted AlkP superfamily pyrophosphatase or phosphodiesterase
MRKNTLIVLSLAGLSPSLLQSGDCPALEGYAGKCGGAIPVDPVLPALTLSMQATLTTGALPAAHGIVGNGFYDRAHMEQRFWSASSGLVEGPRFWDASGKKETAPGAPPKVAALFWWNFLGSPIDTYLNVAPFHLADGRTIPSCYSKPAGLYAYLEGKLGPFPLHRFWGPGVSIESSEWILKATLETAAERAPDLLFSYLPHMDYSLQRSGPGSTEAKKHLRELDDLLAPLLEEASSGEKQVVVLSEYGIGPVSRHLSPNRILREEGLFALRRLGKAGYPDLVGSRAFALCDHQVAHIYVRDPRDRTSVGTLLRSLPGVGNVLTGTEKKKAGIDHPRSGDLVLLSTQDAWFDYSWWTSPEEAPDYAGTVDIHRKIGYDPLELILDRAAGGIAGDPRLIRGSHGLIPEKKADKPVIITPFLDALYSAVPAEIPATAVATLLMNLLERVAELK